MSKKVKVSEMKAGYEYLLDGEQWKQYDIECNQRVKGVEPNYGKHVLCMESAYGGVPYSLDDYYQKADGHWSRPHPAYNPTNAFTKDFEVTQLYDYPTYERIQEPHLPNAYYWFKIANAAQSLSNPNYVPTESEIKELIKQQNEVPWTPGNVKCLAGVAFFVIFGLLFFYIPPIAGFCGGVAALLGLCIWSDRWDRRRIKRKGGRCV